MVFRCSLGVQIKSRRGESAGLPRTMQIPNPWASKGEKMRSRGLAWPHLSEGRVPGALSNGCSFQMWGLIFLAGECFGFFSWWEEGTFGTRCDPAARFPGGLRGVSERLFWVAWGLWGLALVLKPMWELLDEIMDEVSAEPQGDKCPGDKEEPSADAPCKNSSAGHREGHRRLFPLSQETATSISLHFPSLVEPPFSSRRNPWSLVSDQFSYSLVSTCFLHNEIKHVGLFFFTPSYWWTSKLG